MAELNLAKNNPEVNAQTAMQEDEWHDLLPIEKKLITYSLTLGVVLLVIFIFTFGVFK